MDVECESINNKNKDVNTDNTIDPINDSFKSGSSQDNYDKQ